MVNPNSIPCIYEQKLNKHFLLNVIHTIQIGKEPAFVISLLSRYAIRLVGSFMIRIVDKITIKYYY